MVKKAPHNTRAVYFSCNIPVPRLPVPEKVRVPRLPEDGEVTVLRSPIPPPVLPPSKLQRLPNGHVIVPVLPVPKKIPVPVLPVPFNFEKDDTIENLFSDEMFEGEADYLL